jgi:UDP-N-acetylmuramyl pentapeptide phosphotransferase/UDP-N-acetylglucosamine-1-phosphate transferase
MLTFFVVLVVLLLLELSYFKIAGKYNIIDKPDECSSHSRIVLRGGGIIFLLSIIVWAVGMGLQGNNISLYVPFLIGLVLIAGVSFWDDIHSLSDLVRLVIQFVAMALLFLEYYINASWRMDS